MSQTPGGYPRPNPFEAPGPRPAPEIIQPKKPQAILWYNVFCIASVVFYLLLVVVGLFYILAAEGMARGKPEDLIALRLVGGIFLVFGLAMAVLYSCGLFFQKGNGGWIFGLVLIAISLTGICLIAGVPVLIFWIQPEVKEYLKRRT